MKTYENTLEIMFLAAILHLYGRLAVPVNDLEGPKATGPIQTGPNMSSPVLRVLRNEATSCGCSCALFGKKTGLNWTLKH
jgi:hypothetical protein